MSAWKRRPAPPASTATLSPPSRRSLVGTAAAEIAGTDPGGAPAHRRWDGPPQLVAFLTGGCTTCQLFWTGFAQPSSSSLGDLAIVVVTPGPGTESRRGIEARAAGGLAVIMSTEAWLSYGVRGAPWFVLVAGGIVRAEGPAGSWDQLRTLTAT